MTTVHFEYLTHVSMFIPWQRLSYLVSHNTIIFEWPSAIHETPIKEFVRATQNGILPLSHHSSLISMELEQNQSVSGINTDAEFMLDAFLEFSSEGHPRLNKYQAILEVAFSQPWDSVLDKVKDFITEFPDILMVTIVNITERKYQALELDSDAWQTFSARSVLDLNVFLSLDGLVSQSQEVASVDTESNKLAIPPVVSGRHCWCSLERIKYHIWVKKELDGKCINVDDINDDEHYTYGVRMCCSFCLSNAHTILSRKL